VECDGVRGEAEQDVGAAELDERVERADETQPRAGV